MELHIQLLFGLIAVFSDVALTQLDNNIINLNDVSYLFATPASFYYTRNTTYLLANQTTLVHENFDYHYAKGLVFYQPNLRTITSDVSCLPIPLNVNSVMPGSVHCPGIQLDILPLPPDHFPSIEIVDAHFDRMVTALAVDWVNDRVVWATLGVDRDTMQVTNTVVSGNLKLGDRKILQVTNSMFLSVMAIDPFARKIFWIEDLTNIVSCNLDGGDCKVILKIESYNVDLVTKLTLDLSTRRIFFIKSLNSAQYGNYSLHSIRYDGAPLRTNVYTWEKTAAGVRRDIRSIYFVRGRLFVFSSLSEKGTYKKKSFVLQSLVNATTVEGEWEVFCDRGRDDGSNSEHPVLDARLVHPDLQPASDPTY